MRSLIRTRFAPSPTGPLHLGHVASALDGWRRARASAGAFLLRLEDIDPTRCRPGHAAAILDDLRWLGLDWDEPVRVQSEHLPEYRAVLEALDSRGLLYPCFCSRADIAAASGAPHAAPDGSTLYPGTCRALDPARRAALLAEGAPHALRLRSDLACRQAGPLTRFEEKRGRVACDPAAFGDVVLARKDSPVSYHLCCTHDDALAGITLVTRGEDLAPSADLHRLLQTLMGWPEPGYAHHPLLRDPSGERLSKRNRSAGIGALRAEGWTPEAVRRLADTGAPVPLAAGAA
ncbi:tRNA glutamyl-Q(34) synthetase GluQRS [Acetobacteraceae bacterium KSS8]|uniref:tRNA glutamyl-Q(34) synthetase GluQRS n=1 Tax=Endosaccharibacter trunci TaxID=2812733 RepID=A0ABT1W7I8_9PROT|nr:tRNA glutamyl-Q(34) synthetase GluQRS [Acetobacteraceae bacterium KSS8]